MAPLNGLFAPQLAQAKASEIVALLQRLSDVNDEMGGAIVGGSDARSHTLARHRDVLQEYTQVGVARGGTQSNSQGDRRPGE